MPLVGQIYSFQLQATGGTPPYTWNKYPPRGRGVLPISASSVEERPHLGHTEEGGPYTIIVKCLGATAHPHKTQATEQLTITVNP